MPNAGLPAMAAAVALACGVAGCGRAAVETPPSADPGPLYVECRGQASAAPTVILQSGAFGTASDWDFLLGDLSRGGRVCAYDRGGIGRSGPRIGDRDSISIARELAALLDRMSETGPVILVGHSNGALYAETFAAMYPTRVAGLVYVNGVGSDDLDSPALIRYLREERCWANLAVIGADLGLAPLIAPTLVRADGLQGEAARKKRAALSDVISLRVARDEDRAIIPSLGQSRALGGSPPSIPTAVIVGVTKPDLFASRAWRAAEVAPAARARQSWVLDAVGATHVSPLGRDRAYVIAAVDWLRSLPRPDVGH